MSLFSISFRTDSYSNEYLVAKIGFDTAEKKPCKVCPTTSIRKADTSRNLRSAAFANALCEEGVSRGFFFVALLDAGTGGQLSSGMLKHWMKLDMPFSEASSEG